MSEHKFKCSERSEEYSPYGAPECPYDLGGKTAVPGGVNNIQEHPKKVRDERVDETNACCRDIGPGGRLCEQVRPGDVERNLERQNVVEGVGYEGIGHVNDDSGENVETNAPNRVKRVRRHGR